MILCAGLREVTLAPPSLAVTAGGPRPTALSQRCMLTSGLSQHVNRKATGRRLLDAARGLAVCAQCLWMSGLEATARGLDCSKTSHSECSITARGLVRKPVAVNSQLPLSFNSSLSCAPTHLLTYLSRAPAVKTRDLFNGRVLPSVASPHSRTGRGLSAFPLPAE